MNVGKHNCYTCEKCAGSIVTIDLAHGVTPFMVGCRATEDCKGWMQSGFYHPQFKFLKAGWEWVARGPGDIPDESLKLQKAAR